MPSAHATTIDAAAVSEDAYVFAYPLVLAELARIEMTSVPAPAPHTMRAPPNELVHAHRLGSTGGGTLRTSAWLDVGPEPVVLSVPETHGRYYVMSMIDMWTNAFASVGPRTTGIGAGAYAICAADWDGQLPVEMLPIAAPTRHVRIAGRTCIARGEGDADALAVQHGYSLTPLSRWPPPHPAPALVTGSGEADRPPPADPVDELDARTFFRLACRLLADNPPRTEDRRLVARAQQIGLFDGCDRAWMGGDAALQGVVERGATRGRATVRAARSASVIDEASGHWYVDYRRGAFGTDYVCRAGAACMPLGPDSAADALPAITRSDADGRPLVGRNRYVLRFGVDGPPPVHGFWAVSTHAVAAPGRKVEGAPVSLGDQDGLTIDVDGSLPIHIQHDRPPRGRRSNWLATPTGAFQLMLRLHWPCEDALARRWTPPAVTRVG